jgi:metal-responsive CopG/Arc/MetJ family transcriptional regulator
MDEERKSIMVSTRLPVELVARADFIVRNTDGDIKSRSRAVLAALQAWLPIQEKKLENLGVISKKAHP